MGNVSTEAIKHSLDLVFALQRNNPVVGDGSLAAILTAEERDGKTSAYKSVPTNTNKAPQ